VSAARSDATGLPGAVAPMLATPGTLPPDPEGWAFEVKWDGMRAILHCNRAEWKVRTRSLRDVTRAWPELAVLRETLQERAVVLDGEIVALDEEGVPSFERLQPRMHAAPPVGAELVGRVPAVYVVFDLLWLDGEWLTSRPYDERRDMLSAVLPSGPSWNVAARLAEPAGRSYEAAMEHACRGLGLEGVVAKRRDSPYLPGVRSHAWRKVKFLLSQEFVVGGWSAGTGTRSGNIGSLLLGVHDRPGGPLHYCGRAGSGLSRLDLDRLGRVLARLRTDVCPFTRPPEPRNSAEELTWARPLVVVEAGFSEWTAAGVLRQPVFRGVRPDKDPSEVVRET